VLQPIHSGRPFTAAAPVPNGALGECAAERSGCAPWSPVSGAEEQRAGTGSGGLPGGHSRASFFPRSSPRLPIQQPQSRRWGLGSPASSPPRATSPTSSVPCPRAPVHTGACPSPHVSPGLRAPSARAFVACLPLNPRPCDFKCSFFASQNLVLGNFLMNIVIFVNCF
jgi:hypothetical protein